MKSRTLTVLALAAGLFAAGQAFAQQPPATAAPTAPPDLNAIPEKMPFNIPFGTPITMERAQGLVKAAVDEATKRGWAMNVAVVDPNGTLVYYEKIDNTQIGSAQFAISKARSAALFKRPTKWFQDQVSKGGDGLRYLGLEGATPLEGGIPIVMEGKIVGAIALSGGTSSQDAQCAQVGADALK